MKKLSKSAFSFKAICF